MLNVVSSFCVGSLCIESLCMGFLCLEFVFLRVCFWSNGTIRNLHESWKANVFEEVVLGQGGQGKGGGGGSGGEGGRRQGWPGFWGVGCWEGGCNREGGEGLRFLFCEFGEGYCFFHLFENCYNWVIIKMLFWIFKILSSFYVH